MNATKSGGKKRRQEQPIGKVEALEILQSALGYCQKAGIGLAFDDTEGGASFTLAGCKVQVVGDIARLVMREVDPA